MAQQSDLQELLTSLVPDGKRAYFQPPTNVEMEYPCIEYHLNDIHIRHADNVPYKHTRRYQVTVITPDPNSDILGKVASIPTVAFNRAFTADNLHHFVFTLFF